MAYRIVMEPEQIPLKNCVQCTSPDCNKGLHEDCVRQNTNDNFVCLCCNEFEYSFSILYSFDAHLIVN